MAPFGSPNMTRMPSLLRPAWRLSLAAAFAFLALAAWSAPARAGVSVTIQPPGDGTPQTISTDDVTPDIRDQSYKVGSQRIAVARGVSILALLDKADANFDYAAIEIPRGDGSTLRLTKDQVEDIKPAGFYTDDQNVTHFIGPTGRNGTVATSDYFTVGESITLVQQRASKLKVTISPDRKKIELGGSVSFRARVSGAVEGETVTYEWWLEGKKPRFGGEGFTQKFPKKDGVYKFSVSVGIEGSGATTTKVAIITVGDPKKAEDEQVGDGDAGSGSDGGGTTGGSDGGSGYDGSSGYTPSYTPSTPPAPAMPTPPPIPPPTPSKPSQPPDIATSGTTVEGNLLADVSDPPPSNILESAARAAREGKQKRDEQAGDGAGVSEAALSIAGVLALLGLGAGIETRQGRLPRLRLPRRSA